MVQIHGETRMSSKTTKRRSVWIWYGFNTIIYSILYLLHHIFNTIVYSIQSYTSSCTQYHIYSIIYSMPSSIKYNHILHHIPYVKFSLLNVDVLTLTNWPWLLRSVLNTNETFIMSIMSIIITNCCCYVQIHNYKYVASKHFLTGVT